MLRDFKIISTVKKVKSKVFPRSLPSVGPGADPGVRYAQVICGNTFAKDRATL